MGSFNNKKKNEILLSKKKVIFLIKFFCFQQEFNQRIDLSFKDKNKYNKEIKIIKKNVMKKIKESFFYNEISKELFKNKILNYKKKKEIINYQKMIDNNLVKILEKLPKEIMEKIENVNIDKLIKEIKNEDEK